MRVVADIRDALGAQPLGADAKNLFLNLAGHPGVNAVGNDVVEGAETFVHRANIQVAQFDVGQT
jgi:hypothetical protein